MPDTKSDPAFPVEEIDAAFLGLSQRQLAAIHIAAGIAARVAVPIAPGLPGVAVADIADLAVRIGDAVLARAEQ